MAEVDWPEPRIRLECGKRDMGLHVWRYIYEFITEAIKHINGRGGACSAHSGRGKQRPYIMGCDV
jgi:hypothetical protein